MLIVILGALPALPVAAELAKRLPLRAPALHRWLQGSAARIEPHDLRAQGCTAFESWQLRRAGYTPEPGLLPGAGLGPLLATDLGGDEPVWLAELVHLALGTDQATLLDPTLMDLRDDETAALLDRARPLFEDTGFAVEPLSAARWRLRLPDGLRPATASPLAVAGQRLNDWWRQDAATRPWRRLFNDIQMSWHEHPVNKARAARGLPPVNALWLYGGGTPWAMRPAGPERILTDLVGPQRAGDWAAWLDALAVLDARLQALADAPAELLLLGDDRSATLTPKPRGGLLGWLPAPKKNWNVWWSHPA